MNIQLFTELFKGRTDVYGTNNACIRSPLTDSLIELHLKGKKRIGVYPMLVDKCNFIAIDIDIDDLQQAKNYHKATLKLGLPCYIENSKSKGYHCWHFFESPVLAKKARMVINFIFSQLKHTYEMFPKQDYTQDVGNYINLPLFNEGKDKRTVFLDTLNGCKPIDDQWRFLAGIEKIPPEKIDQLIQKYKIQTERRYKQATNEKLSANDIDRMERDFINRAIDKASLEGRNNAGLDLANQLRDHDVSEHEAKNVMLRYQSLVSNMKDEPYSEKEALASLKSAYKAQKREPWWKPLNNRTINPPLESETIIVEEEEICDHDDPPIDEKPPFPEIKNAICNDYIDIMIDVTEAPPSYHFFSFLTAVSMVINRTAYISWGVDKIYPNLWTMIVGPTGRARKSSTIRRGQHIVREIMPESQTLYSMSTWEGLLSAMMPDLEDSTKKNNLTIVCMSEFDALLKKSRQEAIAHLIPNLCDLYDCPDVVRNTTKGTPLKVENPYLCILAGIQPDVVEKSFQSGDVHGGFAGRFMYVHDSCNKEIPIPIWNKENEYQDILKRLRLISNICIDETVIKLNPDCNTLWNTFYHDYRSPQGSTPLLLQLNERMQNHVLKIAMIFAILEGKTEIGYLHLQDAISIGYWLIDNNRRLFGMIGKTLHSKIEQQVIDAIKSGKTNSRELFQRFGGNISSRDLQYALEGLIKMGVIIEKVKANPRGRATRTLELAKS